MPTESPLRGRSASPTEGQNSSGLTPSVKSHPALTLPFFFLHPTTALHPTAAHFPTHPRRHGPHLQVSHPRSEPPTNSQPAADPSKIQSSHLHRQTPGLLRPTAGQPSPSAPPIHLESHHHAQPSLALPPPPSSFPSTPLNSSTSTPSNLAAASTTSLDQPSTSPLTRPVRHATPTNPPPEHSAQRRRVPLRSPQLAQVRTPPRPRSPFASPSARTDHTPLPAATIPSHSSPPLRVYQPCGFSSIVLRMVRNPRSSDHAVRRR